MTATSTSPAHTAGPWQYIKSQDDDVQNGSEHFAILAGTSRDGWFIAELLNGLEPEAEANARLIAAAPSHDKALREMVAAIEDMLEDDGLHITSDCGDLLLQVANIGNAAIAKAEGRA